MANKALLKKLAPAPAPVKPAPAPVKPAPSKPADYGIVPPAAKLARDRELAASKALTAKSDAGLVDKGAIGTAAPTPVKPTPFPAKPTPVKPTSTTPLNPSGPMVSTATQMPDGTIKLRKGGRVKAKAKSSYSSGGKVSSASKRGDGIATKGKTKGRMI